MEEKELVDFMKKALVVLCCCSEQLTRATTITLVWDGRSGVVCSLWYGASKCSGSPTMDTFSVAPWVAVVTQARIITFLGGRVTT
jgi:hypothetical protein